MGGWNIQTFVLNRLLRAGAVDISIAFYFLCPAWTKVNVDFLGEDLGSFIRK